MKTIFICIDWFHPAFRAGGPVQSISNLVAQYEDTDIHFKIYCGNTDLEGSVNSGVAFNKWVAYNERTEVWYASPGKRSRKVIKQEISRSNPNLVFVVGIYSWCFNLLPLLAATGVARVISVRGMLHPGALAQKSFKKKIYLGIWKFMGIHRRCIFHATDETERLYIEGVFGKNVQVKVAANFPRMFTRQPVYQKNPGSINLICIAVVSPMKNILLVLEALSHCKGNILFDIYGPLKDPHYWQSCLNVIALLPSNIRVSYHGELSPDNVEDALRQSHVFVMPSESENFGHALYEALTAGKPIITSFNTPWTFLAEARAGKNSVVGLQPIKESIEYFTGMDQAEYAAWSAAASCYAAKRINLSAVQQQYQKLFELKQLG